MDQQESHLSWLTLPENNIDDISSFACDTLLETSVNSNENSLAGADNWTSLDSRLLSNQAFGMEEEPPPLVEKEDDSVFGMFAAELTPPRSEFNLHVSPSPELNFTAEALDPELLDLSPSGSRSGSPGVCRTPSPTRSLLKTPSPTLPSEESKQASPSRYPFGRPPQQEQQQQQEQKAPPVCVPVHPSMVQLAMIWSEAALSTALPTNALPTTVPSLLVVGGGTVGGTTEKKKRRRACQSCHNRKVVCKSSVSFAAYPCIRCVKAGKGDECKPNLSKKRKKGPSARPKVSYPPLYDLKTGKRIPRLADEHNVNVGQCERDSNCGRPNRHPGHCRSKSSLPRSKRRRTKQPRQT
mmetsp:Transcript_25253/g.47129  ORF Transcript_25253/g.47129 Transcript_25253/m.47129 type:complete len:353 (-) Transcript_25253:298-1356(-)